MAEKIAQKGPWWIHENDQALLKKMAELVANIPGMDQAPMPPESSPLWAFSCKEKPTLSLHDYVLRCTARGFASQEALVCACIWLARIWKRLGGIQQDAYRFLVLVR